MRIQVTIKNVYGNELVYPACDVAKTFAALTRKKTLDLHDLEKIRSLGYAIEPVLSIESRKAVKVLISVGGAK